MADYATRRFCANVLFSGSCADSACRLIHDAKLCEPCGAICSPIASYQSHLTGKIHRNIEAARAASTWMRCPLCGIRVVGDTAWASHIAGAKHTRTAAQRGVSPDVVPIVDEDFVPDRHKRCILCHKNTLATQWQSHIQSREHRAHESLAAYKAAIEQAEQDKPGITVSHPEGVDFGIVSIDTVRRTPITQSIQIQSALSASSTRFSVYASVSSTARNASLPFGAEIVGNSVLTPGQEIRMNVSFRLAEFGRFSAKLELAFLSDTQGFFIVRQLHAVVGDETDQQALKPTTPYVAHRRVLWRRNVDYLSGSRPPAMDAVPWVRKLGQYPIPPKLLEVLGKKGSEEVARAVQAAFLPRVLRNMATHTPLFKTLLWVEEHRTEVDLRVYDMGDVTFRKEGRLYYFDVPGLSEKRPSVVVGDHIEVQASESTNSRCFEGWVHVVRRDDVGVDFHSSFKANGQHYNVRFKLNRISLRRQHQALSYYSPEPDRFLFPNLQHAGLTTIVRASGIAVAPMNPDVGNNQEQLQAVRSILHMKAGAAPFIIFGPPGTGKTMTAVEVIRQIVSRDPNARILACAPSNSAADEITRRLMMLGKDSLFRHNAISRDKNHISEDLLRFTLINPQGHFSVPPVRELSRYKVLVSTCGSASFAYDVGLPPGHFTHIFVDEAGQATEPEVMTSLKTMTVASTRIILSGDPKQLGPIIRSSVARTLGLGTSYLERLMTRELYNAQRRGISFIKLVKNFRSHEAILRFPNEQFYENELRTCGPAATINRYLSWNWLVNPKFPVIFHAVHGKDEREASSPSYFNIDEITVGKDYINKLLTDTAYRGDEIGVIASYNAQVRKFRRALSSIAEGRNVKIASVEEFQGDERSVIILSTVRSNSELLSYDVRYSLGFVANPRRFNVAITRAKSLLIVIGDPSVLCLDPMWRRFLNYVHNNNGWRGIPISWDPNTPVQDDGAFIQAMQEQRVAEIMSFMERAEDPETGGFEGQANRDRVVIEDRD